MEQKLLNILKNLCTDFRKDGTVHEEIITMLVDAGADYETLKYIGFTDSQISDYVYYISQVDGVSEASVRDLL